MILFCGDPHGRFEHILQAVEDTKADAVVLLGDMEAPAPLSQLLEPIRERVWLIHGNHDTDSETSFQNLWMDRLVTRNLDGKVATLPGGVNSSSVQMTRLGHKGYPLVLFCRNLTEARAAMCAELFSMFR